MEFVDDLQKMMQMMDSESDSDAEIDEQFEMMLAMSKEAEKINKQPPSARPSKNRSVCISMQENKCEKSSSMFKMQFGFKQTWITGNK